jgi:hypothetical protein
VWSRCDIHDRNETHTCDEDHENKGLVPKLDRRITGQKYRQRVNVDGWLFCELDGHAKA